MRYFTYLISIILLLFLTQPSYCGIKGGIEYSIPIDYTPVNEREMNEKAEYFFNQALQSGGKIDENMTAALNLYTILSNKNPENIIYSLRLGNLYDIIGKDRYAKGNYYRAMGIDKTRPEPYFYLGEFFYKREYYRRALKFYKEAYKHGYDTNPQTLKRLQEVYTKLGDNFSHPCKSEDDKN